MKSFRDHLAQVRQLPKSGDLIVARCQLLNPRDRALVEAVLLRSQSPFEIGQIMQIPTNSVRYQISKLVRRITSRSFVEAAKLLLYTQGRDAEVLRRYFCQGQSLREVSRGMGMTLHDVRRRVDRLKGEINYQQRESERRRIAKQLKAQKASEWSDDDARLAV